jgi:glucan-binding YG repeat protein
MFDFVQLNGLIAGYCVPENTYTVKLTALMENNVPQNGQIYIQRQDVDVWQMQLQVGAESAQCVPVMAEAAQIPDGWYWDGNNRYYYRDGKPRTGWFCEDGADYYFQADGSVTTGWAVINGYPRYFSDTGIMRTGWVYTEAGWHYMRSNGTAVSGFCKIGGKQYYFDGNTLVMGDVFTVDGKLYVADANGVVLDS